MKLTKEDFEQYIIPINGAREGTGVLVGNLFIIAGHVVAKRQLVCSKPASWIIGASVKTSISPIPQHKIATTTRAYTRVYFVVVVLLGGIYVAHMSSFINLLSDVLL